MDYDQTPPKMPKTNKLNLSLDLRVIILILLLVIGAMLFFWKPWEDNSTANDGRVITVTGESKIAAEPDEFVFNPMYEFKNANKEAALASLTKKSEEVISALKGLGVADSKIKSDSDGYNYNYYYDQSKNQNNYSLRLTVTADSRELAEKVQNYLVSTAPTGSVSPQANFSDQKRKELENKARDEATNDARSKAEQSAKNLGFKIGKVKSINDGTGSGGIQSYLRSGSNTLSLSEGAADSKLAVQPGEDDLRYTVEVVYYVR